MTSADESGVIETNRFGCHLNIRSSLRPDEENKIAPPANQEGMMFLGKIRLPLFPILTAAWVPRAAALAATVTPSPPATFTLDNGLRVVVIPDHRTPVV